MPTLGIILSLGALIFWGFGDFFIQKSTRDVGDVPALFYIGAFGGIVLLPFVLPDLHLLASGTLLILLLLASFATFFGSLFDFEALKEGKIAIIEPIIGLELPLIVGLSIALHGEHLTILQTGAMVLVFFGILLCVTNHKVRIRSHKDLFERGVVFAGLGAIGMALFSFLLGVSSQASSPLLAVWFVFAGGAVLCFLLLAVERRLGSLVTGIKKFTLPVLAESAFDTAAWLCFSAATVYLPISIVTSISESYIALAVFLGLFVNHERIKRHQLIGALVAFAGVLVLARFA